MQENKNGPWPSLFRGQTSSDLPPESMLESLESLPALTSSPLNLMSTIGNLSPGCCNVTLLENIFIESSRTFSG